MAERGAARSGEGFRERALGAGTTVAMEESDEGRG
jgi:hypothetical protein